MEIVINRIIKIVELLGVISAGVILIIASNYYLRLSKKSSYDFVDGTVIGVDNDKKELIVRYCYDGVTYEKSINAYVLFAANEIPQTGLQIGVKIDRDDVSNPIDIVTNHAIGRGADFTSGYTNFSKKRIIASLIVGVSMVCIGAYNLIKIIILS